MSSNHTRVQRTKVYDRTPTLVPAHDGAFMTVPAWMADVLNRVLRRKDGAA